jgi:hypothetical protein
MDELKNKMDENMKDMEKNINENWENVKNKILELQNSMILHDIDERLPKEDIKVHRNHENVDEIKMESHNHDFSSLQDPHHQCFIVAPRIYFIPKICTRKLDGKYPITWIFQIDKFFYLHQVPRLQMVPIASLYLENDQCVLCNNPPLRQPILLLLH